MGHIELARWADAVVIAPATADFIARLAHGLADDLLSTVCLATSAPITLAPAMNRLMWSNPATQANVKLLESRGIALLGPAVGEQACGETGAGRMLEPREIADTVLSRQSLAGAMSGLKVVVTAGPTRERIDPVRFLSNRSSGKMGYAVAAAARDAGAKVVLVSGPVNIPPPPGTTVVNVETAEQMLDAVRSHVIGADIFIAAAAVSDYKAAQPSSKKIKKTQEALSIALARTPDVLGTVARSDNRPFLVGFAAETEDVERNAIEKMESKRLEMIAANRVGDGMGFDQDDNALTVYWQGGKQELALTSKADLARQLIAVVAAHYAARAVAGETADSVSHVGS
jgi:phosphopantothenoylcysteine decarboxylase/phosphopantothenate--cysteine ligase